MKMGTIVCQVCEGTIGHFEDEKINSTIREMWISLRM